MTNSKILIVLLIGIVYVHSFSDYTHEIFGVQYLAKKTQPSIKYNEFVMGSAGPDNFKKVNGYLHSLEFALELKNYATEFAQDNFDTKSFAYGYAAHLLEDYIGHHKNGFLNPKYDHEIEFAADTYYYKKQKNYHYIKCSDEAVHFVFLVISKVKPQLSITLDQLAKARDDFSALMDKEGSLMPLNIFYKMELERMSICSKSSESIQTLELSKEFSFKAIEKYLSLINDSSLTSAQIVSQAHAFINDLYNQHGGTICQLNPSQLRRNNN